MELAEKNLMSQADKAVWKKLTENQDSWLCIGRTRLVRCLSKKWGWSDGKLYIDIVWRFACDIFYCSYRYYRSCGNFRHCCNVERHILVKEGEQK